MKVMKSLLLFATAVILHSCVHDDPWISLFNGTDLSGWHQIGGEALYTVEDGAIIGTTVPSTPNSFLVSDSAYSDFILEMEVMTHDHLNAGIQVRSNSDTAYRNGVFHGYQVEVEDPARERDWSGGIYDEQRRAWLYDLQKNEAGRKAYKSGEWNHYRIEAIGDTLKTWVNGIPCAYLLDGTDGKGHIGLQVHSVGNDSAKFGISVKYRNIRIITGADEVRKHSTTSPLEPVLYKNSLSPAEKEEGWQLLWDGYSSNGWRGAYIDRFPEKGWQIRDGELIVLPSGGAEARHGGDIVTLEQFSNFDLKLEFKLTERANSGIKFFVTLDEKNNPGSAFGPEYQLLDDDRHPDAKMGRDGNRTLGSLYDMIPAPADKPVNPIGEWNEARILAKDMHMEYYLNGKLLIEFDRGSPEWKQLVAMSKYAAPMYNLVVPFGEAEKGHILLQDHGNQVFFRNIRIRLID